MTDQSRIYSQPVELPEPDIIGPYGFLRARSDDQVTKLIQEHMAKALEAAAKACDKYAEDKWALYKGRPPYTGREDGRANQHVEGLSDGAENCADAIRNLIGRIE